MRLVSSRHLKPGTRVARDVRSGPVGTAPLLLSGARLAARAALPRGPTTLPAVGAAPLTEVALGVEGVRAGRASCPPEQAATSATVPTRSDVLAMTVSALAGRHDRPG
jgi:hypothetical protein